jgi:putative phosphonate metabolism protein
MPPRFALYAAPAADDPLHDFAAQWLGWDPETGETLPPQPAAGLSAARIAELTAEPRQYGFHGTLKPPFFLAEGYDEAQLIVALERFAAARRPLRIPAPAMAALGSFLALRPSAPAPALDALAADCVRDFDRFRAPPSERELARRRAAGLSARQDQYLVEWGYPYVLEEFRLHFTLTGRIADEAERRAVLQYLTEQTASFTRRDWAVDELCLFVQAEPGANFRIAGRYRLEG